MNMYQICIISGYRTSEAFMRVNFDGRSINYYYFIFIKTYFFGYQKKKTTV